MQVFLFLIFRRDVALLRLLVSPQPSPKEREQLHSDGSLKMDFCSR